LTEKAASYQWRRFWSCRKCAEVAAERSPSLERDLLMRIKPAGDPGRVVVELGPTEQAIPSRGSENRLASLPAFKLKCILVPIDFSSCSKKALQYAVPFAKQFGAGLCLLYIGQGYYPVPALGPVDLASAETCARADAHRQVGGAGHGANQRPNPSGYPCAHWPSADRDCRRREEARSRPHHRLDARAHGPQTRLVWQSGGEPRSPRAVSGACRA